MRDMNTPSGDRSIRNIPVSAQHRRPTRHEQEEYLDEELAPQPRRRGRGGWPPLWVIGGVVLLCVSVGLLFTSIFSGTLITVYVKTQSVAVPIYTVAQPNAPKGALSYRVLSVTHTATTTVPASGTRHVSRQASGLVTIYNSYSSATQRLITNTRFETPEGKVYRIHDSVVVPGTIKRSDGTLTPGSVTATIYAESPGDQYNRNGITRFTIPGFKKDSRYEKFYAQSQGSIAGGLVGDEPAVATDQMNTAVASLKKQLDQESRLVAGKNISEGFIFVTGSGLAVYTDVSQTMGDNNTVTLSQGTTYSFAIVQMSELAEIVAKQLVAQYAGEAIHFTDPATLTLSTNLDTHKGLTGSLTITIAGTADLLWQFDEAGLKKALLSKDKSQFEKIIKTFEPAITKAEATFRPFWKSSFPSESSKLTVIVTH